MKNLGMTGGLALVAAGLLANVFVTLDDDVHAGASEEKTKLLRKNNACITMPQEIWFDQQGELLGMCHHDIRDVMGDINGSDIDGDGTPDMIPTLGTSGSGSSSPSDLAALVGSYSLRKIDGIWTSVYIPIQFDYSVLLPDPPPQGAWATQQLLWDVDGDKKLDLVVNIQSSQGGDFSSTTWHRNITTGDALAADINLDGRVDGIDLAIVLGSWTSSG